MRLVELMRRLRPHAAAAPTRRAFLAATMATALGCAEPGRFRGVSVLGDPAFRLPSTVAPRRYRIRLTLDLAGGRFTGEETVEVVVREPVGEIVLNAARLSILDASVRDESGRSLRGAVALDEAAERVRIRFPEILAPGEWRLALSFAGSLERRARGLYLARTRLADGTDSLLAATQFQSADARRAFPCWDEPAFKAVFEVTLVVDRRLAAVSNAPVAAEAPMPGGATKAVRFAPTMPLSTYLVAFVVGDLEATPPRVVDGVPIRVWGVRGRARLAGLGLEAAAFALRFYRDYFDLPYPGEKLDLIAVPGFESGAMENFGAVFFRETNLLVDESRASLREIRSVVDNVAHELAHMWFGDLVTMAWWNGLWLNEAFATFMQILAVDAWRPAWQRWAAFGAARAGALETDALASTRPVEYAVRSPADAEAMFDDLTYKKGAAIVRMLEQHLGPEVFRRGVVTYLDRHRFGNAETSDLWRAMGSAVGRSIAPMMDAWVFRPGYPLVSAAAAEGGPALVLSQRRFVYGRDGGHDGAGSTVWHVPVHLRVGMPDGVRRLRVLLSGREARVELPARPRWVVVNAEGVGFYRTRYAADLFAALAEDLFGRLSAVERLGLVGDTWAGALAGVIPLAQYVDLTARLRAEGDQNVWAAVIESFAYLERVVAEPQRPALARVVRDRLEPAARALGWEPGAAEDATRRELRADLLRALGTLGDQRAAQEVARALARALADGSTAVDPSLAAAAIAVSAHTGGEAEYADYLARFRAASSPQDAWRYLFSLARFRPPGLVQRTLGLTLDGTIGGADAPFVLRTMLTTVAARTAAWRFVRDHWDAMRRAYSPGGLDTVCEGVAGLATPELEADVREFFAGRRAGLGAKALDQSLERLRIAAAFREREAAALEGVLRAAVRG